MILHFISNYIFWTNTLTYVKIPIAMYVIIFNSQVYISAVLINLYILHYYYCYKLFYSVLLVYYTEYYSYIVIVRLCICMYIYMNVYTNFVYMNAFILVYVRMYLYICICMCVCIFICVDICGPLHVCICMSICYYNVTTVETRYRTASQSGLSRNTDHL